MKTIVLGPPGTGKTETLLREVEKYLKTTDPNRIGYFSFTRKAANEARDRFLKRNPTLNKKDIRSIYNRPNAKKLVTDMTKIAVKNKISLSSKDQSPKILCLLFPLFKKNNFFSFFSSKFFIIMVLKFLTG